MTSATQDLARKLADHPRFRWMPGMQAVRVAPIRLASGVVDPSPIGQKFTVLYVNDNAVGCWGASFNPKSGLFAPNLDDPATIGCVEAQVREMRPDLRFDVEVCDGGISVWARRNRPELAAGWEYRGRNLTEVDPAKRGRPRGDAWAAAFMRVAQ